MFLFNHLRNFYGRFERRISSLFLLLGFIVDAFTLKRVDTLFENIIIGSYLTLIGILIILTHLKKNEGVSEKDPTQAKFWYVNMLQFFFGGVFSAYLVLYFRSSDIWVAWPFIAILATIFIANEFLKGHYVRLSFQISLFFLSIYWFAIFIVPVILHRIGPWVFLLSGLVSLILITIFIAILFYFTKDKFSKSKSLITLLISGVLLIVNFFYFTNLIPPIPLSLKEGGIFHSIKRNEEGKLVLAYEDHGWKGYFSLYPDFKEVMGEYAYAFSAIFSPSNLNTTITHEWQHYDRKWVTKSVVKLPIVGGREGGFRTYSKLSNLAPGKWRVNIKKENQLIGRLRFNVVLVDTEPALTTVIKQK